MKRFLSVPVLVAAILASGATLAVAPAVQPPATVSTSVATTTTELVEQHIFGTVRRDNATGKWYVLNDAGHTSKGIASVENYQGKALKITFETPAVKVGVFAAGPDETLARVNVRMGPSVALTHAYVYMYQGTSQVPISPDIITGASANIWIEATNWVAP